jgi:hypothetical protein
LQPEVEGEVKSLKEVVESRFPEVKDKFYTVIEKELGHEPVIVVILAALYYANWLIVDVVPKLDKPQQQLVKEFLEILRKFTKEELKKIRQKERRGFRRWFKWL